MVDGALEKKMVIDSRRNIWLFYLRASGKIGCAVKRSRGETETVQPEMDETATEYDIMVDEKDNIHIMALTAGQRVVYLRHDTRGWTEYTLYSFAGKPVYISNIKTISVAENLHLFYVYSEKGGSSALFHHQWTGKEWKGYRVFDMPNRAGNICYDADTGRSKGLRVVAAEGKTLSLWEFDGVRWAQSAMKKNSVWENAEKILFQQGCILVKSGRGVFFIRKADDIDNVQPEEIVEGRHVNEGPVLIDRRNTLYAAWAEGGSLGYRASYDGGASWGRVKYYHHAQGEKLEVYGFSNNYSLLINAKKIIATSPPEIHIPFLHRSVERIKMQEYVFEDTVNSGGYDNGKPVNGNGGYGGGGPEGDGAGCPGRDEQICEVSSTIGENMTGSCGNPQTTEGFPEETGMEIKRIREEIEALRQKIESEVSERLDKLAAEVADLKSRLKDTGKKSALIQPEGSIITQDMINRYMERK